MFILFICYVYLLFIPIFLGGQLPIGVLEALVGTPSGKPSGRKTSFLTFQIASTGASLEKKNNLHSVAPRLTLSLSAANMNVYV